MAVLAPVTVLPSSASERIKTVRPMVGLVLLILTSLFSTIKLTNPAEQFASRFAGVTDIVPDPVTLAERRLSGLRPLLPSHRTVGYVTDEDMGGRATYEKYLVARYVLAPVIVEDDPRHDLVVGNVTQPATDLQRFLRRHDLTLLKHLGDGVLLLGGTTK